MEGKILNLMKSSYPLLVVALFLSQFNSHLTFAQPDLKRVVPPSPTVAALAKYGDTPINYYTGTPSISLPLYEIKTNDFSLPISLSYHASGVKVEESASWVGLGWSLNAGGVVSRSVQGQQDEINGYMNPGSSYLVNNITSQSISSQEETFRTLVNSGAYFDLQPDMFYFNFGEHSGKFYYNQQSSKFVCVPQKPIYFDASYFLANRKWKIKTEDGTEYQFDLKEQNVNTASNGGSALPSTTTVTGWFLTKIITPISKQEITFSYETATYTVKNINSHSITNAAFGGSSCATGVPVLSEATNEYTGYRLTSIAYPGGHVDFKSATSRSDLSGDKRLDTIKVYVTGKTQPIKRFALGYGYFNSAYASNYNSLELPYHLRLKLSSVSEIDSEGHSLPSHTFEYNEESELASRLSFAQDNWGFYNGVNTNPHMIPPMRLGSLLLSGANRKTDTVYSKLGSIKKITYPTGGYTEFDFQSHSTKGLIPYSANDYWVAQSVVLYPTDNCGSQQHVYCKPVTINNHADDGAFVNIMVREIRNCVFCPNGSSCAVLSLQSGSNTIPITCDVVNLWVPNGTYTLTANFVGAGPTVDYSSFYINVTWEEYTLTSLPQETKVGGLRIGKITDCDGFGNCKSKSFRYKDVNNASSGVLVTTEPVYQYPQLCSADGGGSFITRTSVSNIPMGTTSGSHIGYSVVTVLDDNSGSQGMTKYYFTTADNHWDITNAGDYLVNNSYFNLSTNYPFAPVTNFDHRRGLLIKQEDYIKTASSMAILRSIVNEYQPLDQSVENITTSTPLYDVAMGIKLGRWGYGYSNPYAIASLYKTVSEWVRPTRTIENVYTGNKVLQKITVNEYGNTAHMQLTKSKTYSSDSSEIQTYTKYPLDFSVSGSPTDIVTIGIKKLQNDHFVTTPIEKTTTITRSGSEYITSSFLTTFKSDRTLPADLYALKVDNPILKSNMLVTSLDGSGNFVKDSRYEKRITYTLYDSNGNLIEQSKVSDGPKSYVWGYDQKYPIAEAVNAKGTDIFHTSFEDDSGTAGDSKTGKKCFPSGTFTKSLTGLSSGKYVLSYWYKDPSGWKFNSSFLTVSSSGAITLTISGQLDEIRFYPASSQMTTYTFDPEIGITSVCDPNNIVTYYEYDSFGRLKRIRDKDNNILKLFKYNYKGQGGIY